MRNIKTNKKITEGGIHVFLVPARSGKEFWQEKQRKEVPSLIRLVFENPVNTAISCGEKNRELLETGEVV